MQTAIVNAKIYIEPGHFESALLVQDGAIAAVGSDAEIRRLAHRDARVLDARGNLVLPGMNDSHQHLFNIGQRLSTLDLSGARSIGDVIEMGRRFIAEHPEAQQGVYAAGWNQDYFTDEKRLLQRSDLDQISQSIPLYFVRICGHIAAANTAALRKAGITGQTPQPEGGRFGLAPDGQPDGIFNEHALDMIADVIPPVTEQTWKAWVRRAMQYAVSVGLTSVQSNDAQQGDGMLAVRVMQQLHDEGSMPLRYRHQISFSSQREFSDFLRSGVREKTQGDRLAFGPLKLFKDGSLGARTALLRSDYRDDPGNRGVEALSQEEALALCETAQRSGMQVVTHVIGDGAVEQMLEIYEKVLAGGKNTLRHGLVHCQITDAQQLRRIGGMGILTLVQPVFIHYDSHIAESRVGRELTSTSYAFRTLLELGSPVSFGTDAPVEDCNPFPCLAAAVTRTDPQGFPEGGFVPGQNLSVEQAVDCYTAGSAYAEGKENTKGRLKPGYMADLIVLDRDIFTLPSRDIGDARVLLTMTGGQIVFERESLG